MSAWTEGQVNVSPKLPLAVVVALAPTCVTVVPLDHSFTVAPTRGRMPAFTTPVMFGAATPPLDEEEPPDELLDEELPPEEEPLLEVEPPPLEDEELLPDVEPPPLDEEELLLELDPPLEDEEPLDEDPLDDDPLLLEDEPPDDELPLGGGVPPPPPPPPPQAAIVSAVTTVNDLSNVLIPNEGKFVTPLTRLRPAFDYLRMLHTARTDIGPAYRLVRERTQ
jgi:hypothetical protein